MLKQFIRHKKLVGFTAFSLVFTLLAFTLFQIPSYAADSYNITIKMDQPTVDALNKANFSLYAFKSVKTSQSGYPLVWFKADSFGLNTTINWSENYGAYTAKYQEIPQGEISVINDYPINLGNTLDVTDSSGTGKVNPAGTSGAISLNNTTKTPFLCGIGTIADDTFTPNCAFDLFGMTKDIITPIEKVVLMFTTEQLNTGTVVEQAYTEAIQIDLTKEPSRIIGYEINDSWNNYEASDTIIGTGDSLVKYVIVN
jgi:hypothetical protein